MNNKSIVITGGYGFLGSTLAERLINLNNKVTLVVAPETRSKNITLLKNCTKDNIYEIIYMNINDNSDFSDLVNNNDYFFHFAWQTDLVKSMENPKQDIRENLIGLVNILESCKKDKSKIKIIFPSTVTVSGEVKNIPSNEDEKTIPLSIYDANKLAAENYLNVYYKNYGINFSCLRLANVFGERQRTDNPRRGIVNFMIGCALSGKDIDIYGDGKLIRDYSYVQNFVDAFISAAESDNTKGRTYVLGSGEGRTFNEMISAVIYTTKELTGKNVNVNHIPFPEGTNEINKRNFIADSSRFREITGWKPKVSFEEGIKKTIEYYLNKGDYKNE